MTETMDESKAFIIKFLKSIGVSVSFSFLRRTPSKFTCCEQEETVAWLMGKIKISKKEWSEVVMDDIIVGTKSPVYPNLYTK